MATRRRRFGLGAFFAWFAILPKTKLGWQFLFRQFALWRTMMVQYFRGKSGAPWGTIIAIIIGALYVLMPFDLIPDFFLFFGWLDDAFFIAKILSLVKLDLRRYLKREKIDPEPFDLQDK